MAATASLRVVEREARVWRRLWRGTVFSQFLSPVLYLLAMGIGLGGLVNASGTRIDGLTYLEFVAPGLMAATALQNATGEALWPVMAGFKWMGFYHGMVAAPLRPSDVYLGHIVWAALRMLLGAIAFLIVAAVLGAVLSPWGVLAIPSAALCGVALAAPLTAYAATQETDHNFALIMRFLTLPMFLFSGTFFPITQLPPWLQPIAWISPLWHGVVLCRSATTGILPPSGVWGLVGHVAVLVAFVAVGTAWGYRTFTRRLGAVSALDTAPVEPAEPTPTRPAWIRLMPGASVPRPLRLVRRNLVAWRGMWLIFISVMVEPIFFLFSIGIGVGKLVGDVALPSGQMVSYRSFVAAGLLASSAMMGPVFDSTFNFFVKLKYFHVYDATLATPMRAFDVVTGELTWSLVRAGIYALAFLVTMAIMGLVGSWWALLCLPVAVLIGFAFAGAGLGATTFMRSFVDFDLVTLAVVPLFLFSATFFPLSQYPVGLQWVVRLTPLYQGVALERGLLFGELSWTMLLNAAYLAVMGAVGLRVAGRRLTRLLLP